MLRKGSKVKRRVKGSPGDTQIDSGDPTACVQEDPASLTCDASESCTYLPFLWTRNWFPQLRDQWWGQRSLRRRRCLRGEVPSYRQRSRRSEVLAYYRTGRPERRESEAQWVRSASVLRNRYKETWQRNVYNSNIGWRTRLKLQRRIIGNIGEPWIFGKLRDDAALLIWEHSGNKVAKTTHVLSKWWHPHMCSSKAHLTTSYPTGRRLSAVPRRRLRPCRWPSWICRGPRMCTGPHYRSFWHHSNVSYLPLGAQEVPHTLYLWCDV